MMFNLNCFMSPTMHCFYYRRFFKDMPQVALDKKSNFEYLEREVGLKRFLPKNVIDSMKVSSKVCLCFTAHKSSLNTKDDLIFSPLNFIKLCPHICPGQQRNPIDLGGHWVKGQVHWGQMCQSSFQSITWECLDLPASNFVHTSVLGNRGILLIKGSLG